MHKIAVMACCLFFVLQAHAEFWGETDIPLMDDMVVNESESFSFDAPAGQIVGFSAKVSKPIQEVQDFYDTTLMELGWQKKSRAVYTREQDELTLTMDRINGGTIVRIQYAFPNR